MLIRANELADLRRKISEEPSKRIFERFTARVRDPQQPSDYERLAVAALALNDEALARRGAQAIVELLRSSRRRGEGIVRGEISQQPRPGAIAPPNYDFSGLRYAQNCMLQFDLLESFNVFSDAEKEEIKQHMVWLAEELQRSELLAFHTVEHNRKHNFHVEVWTIIGTVALSYPDHPRARSWLAYALREFDWQLEHSLEDGAWHETANYHHHVLKTMLRFVYPLRNNTSIDYFRNSGLRSMCDWLVRIQTSLDSVYGGSLRQPENAGPSLVTSRAVAMRPAVGDGSWSAGAYSILAVAAAAYQDIDPAFAGRLMWAWHRSGTPYADQMALLHIDPSIEPLPQQLESELMPQAGYAVLRSDYAKPSEKYFLFTCGRRRDKHWALHKHKDQNSFSFFADGVPLALDTGTGNYRAAAMYTWNRAAIAHNTVIFAGQDQVFENGRIFNFVSKAGADYFIGDATSAAVPENSMVLQFYRHVLFVKPDYIVIWDYLRAFAPSEWLLHSPAQEIRKSEHGLQFVTPWGVDLDVHFLLPREPLDVWEGEGSFSGHPAAGPKNVQKYVKVRNGEGKDFLSILHSRRTSDEPLKARLLEGEDGVIEVIQGDQRDLIMLFPVARRYENRERGIRMSGRVAVVRRGSRHRSAILIEGEEISTT